MMQAAPRITRSAASRRWVLLVALALAYPAGVALLWTRPGIRWWTKTLGTIVFAPVFVLIALLLVKPLWDFQGGMSGLGDFSLDFDRLSHDRRLEEDRRRQHGATSSAASTAPAGVAALGWSDFRGPLRDGIVREQDIALDWTRRPPKQVYRQPIGLGYASFVVEAGRAYTIEQRRDQEAVTCYDVWTGRELWVHSYPARFSETLGGDGPRATPTLAGGRLYALGGEGQFHCLDAATGSVVWAKNILKGYGDENLPWGLSGSPLLIGGHVIVTGSGKGGSGVVCLDAASGAVVWKTDVGVQAYSSPVATTLAGRPVVLNLAAANLNGLDPTTGRLLFAFAWPTSMGINCSQPIVAGDDRVFISSGYGQGCALVKVQPAGDRLSAKSLWANRSMKNKFNSSVLMGGFIYGLDEGILSCLDLATGERRWKGGRYGYGSLLGLPGHLLVLSEDGVLALVKADPGGFQELGRAPILRGRTWNNFVLLGGRVVARNHKEMCLVDLRTETDGPASR